jgi:uncharacterized protein YkwD
MTIYFSGAIPRRFVQASTFCLLVALTSCQTAPGPGEGAGASASAAEYLVQIRSEHGLPVLTSDHRLEQAALAQSGHMAASGRMTHNTGRGKDFTSRLKKNGIDGVAAENLAHGRMDLKKLFSMWMNSAGHRRNMLDPRIRRFGLAYVRAADGSDVRYWTLVVGD